MGIFNDDPTENAEDKMSNALVGGCIAAVVVVALIGFAIATLVKVWL